MHVDEVLASGLAVEPVHGGRNLDDLDGAPQVRQRGVDVRQVEVRHAERVVEVGALRRSGYRVGEDPDSVVVPPLIDRTDAVLHQLVERHGTSRART
jgi:hypothetical protein